MVAACERTTFCATREFAFPESSYGKIYVSPMLISVEPVPPGVLVGVAEGVLVGVNVGVDVGVKVGVAVNVDVGVKVGVAGEGRYETRMGIQSSEKSRALFEEIFVICTRKLLSSFVVHACPQLSAAPPRV